MGTHAPTEHLDPGETAEPTLSPTFQPTYPSVAPTVEPTTEPTMGPVETLDEPGETYHPTLAPTSKSVGAAKKAQRDVTKMSTAERRAFYLSHFTPEAKARVAKQKQVEAAMAKKQPKI